MKRPQSTEDLDTFWMQLAKVNDDVQSKLKALRDQIDPDLTPDVVMEALNELTLAAQSLNQTVPVP